MRAELAAATVALAISCSGDRGDDGGDGSSTAAATSPTGTTTTDASTTTGSSSSTDDGSSSSSGGGGNEGDGSTSGTTGDPACAPAPADDACTACRKDACCEAWVTCQRSRSCVCLVGCLDRMGQDQVGPCLRACMLPAPPPDASALLGCSNTNCADAC